MPPSGKNVYNHSNHDERGAEPQREPIGLVRGDMLRDLQPLQKQSKARHHKTKAHQCKAGAHPCKKRALGCQIVTQIGSRLYFGGRIHVAASPADIPCEMPGASVVYAARRAQCTTEESLKPICSQRFTNAHAEHHSDHSAPICAACRAEAQAASSANTQSDAEDRQHDERQCHTKDPGMKSP